MLYFSKINEQLGQNQKRLFRSKMVPELLPIFDVVNKYAMIALFRIFPRTNNEFPIQAGPLR